MSSRAKDAVETLGDGIAKNKWAAIHALAFMITSMVCLAAGIAIGSFYK
jgi:hypothetical protein